MPAVCERDLERIKENSNANISGGEKNSGLNTVSKKYSKGFHKTEYV